MSKPGRILRLIYYAIMLFLLVALLERVARSEPFLVYEPTVRILKYQIEVNGKVSDVDPNVISDDKMQLVYDLVNVPVGASAVRARALFEAWGWCEWSGIYTVLKPGPMSLPTIMSNPPLPLPLNTTPGGTR